MVSGGRIPGAWWTLNHRCNYDDEVQRLCTGEGMDEGEKREMLGSVDKCSQLPRFKFERDAPDIVVYMHDFRAKLQMRMAKASGAWCRAQCSVSWQGTA